MRSISTIGLDIAKSVFQVHGVDAAGQAVCEHFTAPHAHRALCYLPFVISCAVVRPGFLCQSATCTRSLATSRAVSEEALAPKRAVT